MKKDAINNLEASIRSQIDQELQEIIKLDKKANELSSKWHEFNEELEKVKRTLSYTITEDEILRTTPGDRDKKLEERKEAIAKKGVLLSYIAGCEEAMKINEKRLKVRREEFVKKLRSIVLAELEPVREEIAREILAILRKDQLYADSLTELCKGLVSKAGIHAVDLNCFPSSFVYEIHPFQMVNIRTQAKHYAESVLKDGGKAK